MIKLLFLTVLACAVVSCSSRDESPYLTPKSVVIDELSTEANRIEQENAILTGENRILAAKLDEEIRERALVEQENQRLLIALDNLQIIP